MAPQLLEAGLRVIDLSRRVSISQCGNIFGPVVQAAHPPHRRAAQRKPCMALPEFLLGANPRTHAHPQTRVATATSVILAVRPLADAGYIGAGFKCPFAIASPARPARAKSCGRDLQFAELDENFKRYSLFFRIAIRPRLTEHTGLPESQVVLLDTSCFPLARGILSTNLRDAGRSAIC